MKLPWSTLNMATVRRSTIGLGLFVGAIFAVVGRAEEFDFVVRLNEAREAVFEGPGREYFEGAFSKAFYSQYPGRLSECLKRTGDTEPAGFDMLLKLTGKGEVESAVVKPESPLARCYRDLTKKDVFPAPPSPGFWVPVSLRFTKP
jgi:hypothetical protein